MFRSCHTDTSKIILVSVRRSFHGNYSCQGRNRAGWGPESEPRQLKVLYPPRGAILTHKPAIIRKGAAFEVSKKKTPSKVKHEEEVRKKARLLPSFSVLFLFRSPYFFTGA